MKKNEIQRAYTVLNNIDNKTTHHYKPKIYLDGINLIPNDRLAIYNIDSLIEKIKRVVPYPSFYIDFQFGYLRLH